MAASDHHCSQVSELASTKIAIDLADALSGSGGRSSCCSNVGARQLTCQARITARRLTARRAVQRPITRLTRERSWSSRFFSLLLSKPGGDGECGTGRAACQRASSTLATLTLTSYAGGKLEPSGVCASVSCVVEGTRQLLLPCFRGDAWTVILVRGA